jgi:SOS-response transcriptional repressor LexA
MVQLGNNSMHPLYEKGTYFLVNFSLKMTDGDLVVVKLHDQLATVRKVFIVGLQMKLFHPVLMKEQGVIVDKNDIEYLGVIEKVIQEL